MANNKFRVVIPENPAAKIALAEKINAKHIEAGAQSPLHSLETNKWEENGPKVATCRQLHNEAETKKQQAEVAYRQRDVLLDPITNSIKASRDLLIGVYRENPKKLIDWGFVVDDTPRAPKKTE
jgi:hypothetical protein